MKMIDTIDTILFDLDGTLIHSVEDIQDALRLAYQRVVGKSDFSFDKNVIGPPIREIILSLTPDILEDQCVELIKSFRHNYDESDFPKTIVYREVKPLLRQLKKNNLKLFIVTHKRTVTSNNILNKNAIRAYFTEVLGVDYFEGRLVTKVEMINHIMQKWGIAPERLMMVGDSVVDIQAAKAYKIASVAVLNGYGSTQELLESGAQYFVKNMGEISKILKLGKGMSRQSLLKK